MNPAELTQESMTLEQLQRAMSAAVMQPLTPNEEMQSHNASGRPMTEVASDFIRPNSRLTAFDRLEIYNRQYWFRLQSAFGDDFPALRAVVGEQRFEALTNAYLEAHPSRSFTLRDLGSKLHNWLTQNPAWAGPRLSLALDVIKVEWACIEAFDNADYPPLAPHEIVQINGDSRLTLQPHVQLLSLRYPADDLVLERHQQQKRESTEAGTRAETVHAKPAGRLRLSRQPIWLAVHRSDLSLYYKRLTRPEYQMLQALHHGATLSEALDAGFEGSRLSAATRIKHVQTWFADWAELSWFTSPSNRLAPDPS